MISNDIFVQICNANSTIDFMHLLTNLFKDNNAETTNNTNGTKNIVDFTDGKVVVAYPNSLNSICAMSEIVKVKAIENYGEVKVITYFADGTSEKAVLNKDDTYSLEYGISICITKRLLKNKREKIANKKAAKRAECETAEREYLINIQKEAYIRAMKEINSSS